MTILCDLATQYDTDKGPKGWGYTTTYFEWLSERRESVKTILEVGVWRGSSLRMWQDFFPNASIFGVENDPKCQLNEGRIKTFCCDGYDAASMAPVMAEIGPVDFFVDDAVHWCPPQTDLLAFMWPFIAPGGIYAVEETAEPDRLKTAIATLPDVARSVIIHAQGAYHLTLIEKAKS